MAQNKAEIVLAVVDQSTGTLRQIEGSFAQSMAAIKQSSASSLDDIASKFSYLLGPAAIGGAVVAASKMGIEWERTMFQMRQTFQGASDAMIAKAAEMAAKTGNYFSQQQIAYAFTKTADSMKRYGIDGSNYLDLVARASDLAAAKGMEVKESIDRIESAMRGEAEASEYLGLTLNDTYMKNMAFGGSLRDTWEKLTDNQKAMYRFNELMEQSAKYQGAAAEASKTFGGQLKSWWNWFSDDFSRGMENANKSIGNLTKKIAKYKGFTGAGSQHTLPIGDTGDDPWGIRAIVDAQNKAVPVVDSAFKAEQAFKAVVKLAERYEALQAKKTSGKGYYDVYLSAVEKIEMALPKQLASELRINAAIQTRKTLLEQLQALQEERDDAETQTGYNLADSAYQQKISEMKLAENELSRAQEERIARIRGELESLMRDPKGGFDNPEAQKKIADMLRERSTIEGDINSRLQQRAELERRMMATDDPSEMLALRDAIYEIDTALVPVQYQLNMLDAAFQSIEELRVAPIDVEAESAEQKIQQLMQKIAEFERKAQEQRAVHVDTSAAEGAIDGLIDKVRQLHEFMSQDIFSSYDISAGIYASPRHEFSEGIAYMRSQLESLPKSSSFDLLSQGWDGLSMSTDWIQHSADARMMVYQQPDISSLPSGLQGEASNLAKMLTDAIRQMQGYYSGPTPGGIAQPTTYWMGEHYSQNIVPAIQAKLDSLFAASNKMGASKTSGVQTGNIEINISDIRSLARQIEEQILRRLESNRSSLVTQL